MIPHDTNKMQLGNNYEIHMKQIKNKYQTSYNKYETT